MMGRPPLDYLAELTEGFCHHVPRHHLHPVMQSWFLIRLRQVHKEGMNTDTHKNISYINAFIVEHSKSGGKIVIIYKQMVREQVLFSAATASERQTDTPCKKSLGIKFI